MRIIKTQFELETLTREFADAPYITVDTEFVRERTYYPVLCLIQVARPFSTAAEAKRSAAIIDPIEGDLDLEPLFELFRAPQIVKVFHAARQDVEIFTHLSGAPPTPLFDTQVAAMVCGFGDQVAYDTLARKIGKAKLDKSSRFTDWARRPLTQKQLSYALADVTHLRDIYEALSAQIERENRVHWVREEMEALANPATYFIDPEEAWRRVKTRTNNRKFLSIARALAAWREREARARDVPRSRLLKDDALLEICALQPQNTAELNRARLLFREGRKAETAEGILAAVAQGAERPEDEYPEAPEPRAPKEGAGGVMELLRVLLKARCEEISVAPRLLASAADLEAIASEDAPDVPAMKGWRKEAFGQDALRLKRGEIALSASASGVRIIEL